MAEHGEKAYLIFVIGFPSLTIHIKIRVSVLADFSHIHEVFGWSNGPRSEGLGACCKSAVANSKHWQRTDISRGLWLYGGFPLIPSDYHSVRVFGVQSIIQPRHYTQEPLVERPDTFVVTVNAVLLVVYWLSQHGRRIASLLLLLLRSSVLHISLSLLSCIKLRRWHVLLCSSLLTVF